MLTSAISEHICYFVYKATIQLEEIYVVQLFSISPDQFFYFFPDNCPHIL